MDSTEIQVLLTAKHAGDHVRIARIAHFMGLLKSGVDGMASMGVVIKLDVPGLEVSEVRLPPSPNVLASIETAIAHMSGHATHQ